MGVIIRRPYCTDSHADYFVRNLTVCKGDSVASSHGVLSQPVRIDAFEPDEPITLEQAKDHIRYTHYDEDNLVQQWIRAAFRKIERDTGVIAMTSEWRIPVDEFPIFRQFMQLPLWPVQSADRVAYYDTDGNLVELSAGSPGAGFILDGTSRPPRLALEAIDDDWPTSLREFQPGIVEVTAGFASADLYPDDLRQAAYLLIANAALYREPAVAGPGVAVTSIPIGYEQWIERWVLPVV
jgi:uncharacterized phiE125 gp8 family phage protein